MKKLVAFLFSTLLVLATIGCGGGGSTSSPINNNKPLDPQGNWLFTITGPNTVVLAGQLFELNPPVVTSKSIFTPPGAPVICGGSYTLNGSASGVNDISLTLAQPNNLSLSLVGTIADDQQHMSGTYTTTLSGCQSASGTWTARLLTSVTGNWSGTLSNNSTNLAVTASLTENVDQTAPNMGRVTGTVTLLGSPCFASSETFTLSDSSHIGEDLVIITSANTDGISLEANGIVDPDATTFNPEFAFTIHGGVCDGQNFTGSLTKH